MTNLNITKIGNPIRTADLPKFETEIGHILPDSYKSFLTEYNGGCPIPQFFDVPTWKFRSSLIQRLKGLDPSHIGVDLREILKIKGDIFPKDFIAIGSDPGGNLILMGLEGESKEKIYFWDHENEPQNQLTDLNEYNNIHFLSDSFEQFISSLKTAKEMGWE